MKLLPAIFFIFILFSCSNTENQMEFNSDKWKPYENGVTGINYRKKMVFDLVHNKLKFRKLEKKGTHLNEVIKLIGEPERINTTNHSEKFVYYYEIEEKFEYNIDPNGGTTLELTFDKDSTLTYWVINEFWYEP